MNLGIAPFLHKHAMSFLFPLLVKMYCCKLHEFECKNMKMF